MYFERLVELYGDFRPYTATFYTEEYAANFHTSNLKFLVFSCDLKAFIAFANYEIILKCLVSLHVNQKCVKDFFAKSKSELCK